MAFEMINSDVNLVLSDAVLQIEVVDPGDIDKHDLKLGDVICKTSRSYYSKYIIQTRIPGWNGGTLGEEELLKKCYQNSIAIARRQKCKSVAMPILAAANAGYPEEIVINAISGLLRDYLKESDIRVLFAEDERDSFSLSHGVYKDMDGFINTHFTKNPQDGTFIRSNSKDYNRRNQWPDERHGNRGMFSIKRIPDSTNGTLNRTDNDSYNNVINDYSWSERQKNVLSIDIDNDKRLDEFISNVGESFQQSLLRLIMEKGYTDTEVYKRANIDRKLFSKIRSNPSYQPKKQTAVALALALKLSLDETKELMACAGYAFSPGSKFDLIVEYFINCGVYDIFVINLALFKYDQSILG